MWPWGHLAVGYLCYRLLSRRLFDRPPSDVATLLVLLGTQFPDLVDKPLAWTAHLLPSGRSLGHSLLTAVVVCALVGAYARHRGRSSFGLAFAVGYVSHLFADALLPVLEGQYRYVAYLGWPLTDLPPYDTGVGFFERFVNMELSLFMLFELGLVAFALVLWVSDGHPGTAALRGWVGSWRRGTEH